MGENLQIATINKRILAYSIDEILISLIFFFTYYDSLINITQTQQLIAVMTELLFNIVIAKFAYQALFVYAYGATIGKIICKIYCLNGSEMKPTLAEALIRAGARIVSENLFYVGFIWAFFNPMKQTWQDLAANIVVVQNA